MAAQIDHIVLWVEDPRASLEFYVNVVGLPPVRSEEFAAGRAPFPSVRISESTIFDLMASRLAPFAAQTTGETTPTAAGKPINHVCLAMDRGGFEALAARLTAAKVPMHHSGGPSFGARGTTTHWFYFQDPDGNVIEARHYE